MFNREMENYIDEFISLNIMSKFRRKYICYFSDGICANGWFKKYQEEIFVSNNEKCKIIQNQYQEYIDTLERQRANYSRGFHMMLFNETKFLKEFAEIKDLSKYSKDCKICLSNGENAYDFFQKIIKKIMNYNDPLYKKVREDYLLYKSKKKKLDYKKTMLLFYKNSGLGKFDIYSHVKLKNNVDAGIWFNEYKDIILDNEGPIEIGIKEQYETFLTHYDLAREFFDEENLDKFDFDSNVRFISRALMNLWWEDNEEKIRYSDLNIDKLIIKQYNIYIKEKKS